MAITTGDLRASAIGTGVALAVPLDFTFWNASEIKAYKYTTATGVGAAFTDFTVTGGSGSTGTATTTANHPTSSETLLFYLEMPLEQAETQNENTGYSATSLERADDKAAQRTKQVDAKASRALQYPLDEAAGEVLPPLESRKGKAIGFNAVTGALELVDSAGQIAIAQAVIDTAAAQAAAETAQTGAETAETNATASETAAGTSETNAAASATAAAGSEFNANAADASASGAATGALAAQTAAEAAETNAEASETAAALSAASAAASASANLARINSKPHLVLDGVAGYVYPRLRGGHYPEIYDDDFTIYCWNKPADGRPASPQTFFGGINGSERCYVQLNSTGTVTTAIGDGIASLLSSESAVLFADGGQDLPILIGLAYDATAETLVTYLNGVAVTTIDVSTLTIGSITAGRFAIGARQNASAETFFAGNLYDYAVFNEVHAASKILAKYNGSEELVISSERWGVMGSTAGCVQWIDFALNQVALQAIDRSDNWADGKLTESGAMWSHPVDCGIARNKHVNPYGGAANKALLTAFSADLVDGVVAHGMFYFNNAAGDITTFSLDAFDGVSTDAELFTSTLTVPNGQGGQYTDGVLTQISTALDTLRPRSADADATDVDLTVLLRKIT